MSKEIEVKWILQKAGTKKFIKTMPLLPTIQKPTFTGNKEEAYQYNDTIEADRAVLASREHLIICRHEIEVKTGLKKELVNQFTCYGQLEAAKHLQSAHDNGFMAEIEILSGYPFGRFMSTDLSENPHYMVKLYKVPWYNQEGGSKW